MPKKKKEVGPHGPLGDATLSFEVPGGTVIALHNAISFTIAHADQYRTEADNCDHCLQALDAFRRYLSRVVDNAPIYSKNVEKKKLN